MSPEDIEEHGRNIRRKLQRVFDNSPYKTFGPVPDMFSAADDLCELIIALAENQKVAAAQPNVTINVDEAEFNTPIKDPVQ